MARSGSPTSALSSGSAADGSSTAASLARSRSLHRRFCRHPRARALFNLGVRLRSSVTDWTSGSLRGRRELCLLTVLAPVVRARAVRLFAQAELRQVLITAQRVATMRMSKAQPGAQPNAAFKHVAHGVAHGHVERASHRRQRVAVARRTPCAPRTVVVVSYLSTTTERRPAPYVAEHRVARHRARHSACAQQPRPLCGLGSDESERRHRA